MSNDWSKKKLGERLTTAQSKVSDHISDESWDSILGDMSKDEYRNKEGGKCIILITDYVCGIGVLACYGIGEKERDDSVEFHALLVQGKGVYLPDHLGTRIFTLRWYNNYHVGDKLYYSDTPNREYNKEILLKKLDRCTVIQNKALTEFLEGSGYKNIQEFVEQEAAKKAKKIDPKKQKAAAIINKLTPITQETMLAHCSEEESHIWGIYTDYEKEKIHYACSCGKEIFCSLEDPEAKTCTGELISGPDAYRYLSYHRDRREKIFVEYIPEDDVFVWRQVIFSICVRKDKSETTFSVPFTIILGEKLLCIINSKGENVGATEIDRVFSTYHPELSNTIVKLNDVDSYYEKSFLKYSGAKDVWAEKPNESWNLARNGYLYSWTKNPCVEQLFKAGFAMLAKDVMNNQSWAKEILNLKKTKATDIIGLPKPFYNLAKEERMSLGRIKVLKLVLNNFPDATVEDTLELMSCKSGLHESEINTMIEISHKYGITFRQIAKYFKEVKENQFFFHLDMMLTYWRDSLKMAKDLNMRFRKDIKYPKSLKMHHDKLTFYTNQLAEVIEAKHFKEAVAKAIQYEYEGENEEDKFFISIPKTPQELIDEGDAQCHCVASYLDLVSNGTCTIAFLRKKEEPDESYFTIEIRENEVRQLKGFSNVLCEDAETLKFVKKWLKKKGLKKLTKDF